MLGALNGIHDPPRLCSLGLGSTFGAIRSVWRVKPSTSQPAASSETVEGRRYSASELFAEHSSFVAKFLWRMGAPDREIEDLVQDVFLVAHLRGGFVVGPAQATTWLASIAFRLWSSERRRFRRHAELSNDEAVALAQAKGPNPAEAFASAESLRRIRTVLEQLDEKSRAILILVDLEGSSCVEVSDAMGIPIGTVYSRLHSARKRFADAYEKLAKVNGREAQRGD
jgi:RNA polymerase sigma-70 factor, ECF subfamily